MCMSSVYISIIVLKISQHTQNHVWVKVFFVFGIFLDIIWKNFYLPYVEPSESWRRKRWSIGDPKNRIFFKRICAPVHSKASGTYWTQLFCKIIKIWQRKQAFQNLFCVLDSTRPLYIWCLCSVWFPLVCQCTKTSHGIYYWP